MVPKFGNRGRTEKRHAVDRGLKKRNAIDVGSKQGKVNVKRAEESDDAANNAHNDSETEDEAIDKPTSNAYSTLLQTLGASALDSDGPRKRRKLSEPSVANGERMDGAQDIDETHGAHGEVETRPDSDEEDEVEDAIEDAESEGDDDEGSSDPYTTHFATSEDFLSQLKLVNSGKWKSSTVEKQGWKMVWQHADPNQDRPLGKRYKSIKDLPLKTRLRPTAASISTLTDAGSLATLSTIFNYQSLLHGGRTTENGQYLRDITALHALNHVLKGRDKVIRNNERLAKAGDDVPEDLDVRDQGFTRPKVLILLETREQCYKWVTSILKFFEPEQKENWTRFADAFHAEDHLADHLPEDYRDIFDGNSDNDFRIGIKFTRKTVKFFSAFYQSDILFCSPLGLRRIIAASDPKKRDHDFLSSIDIAILDQADAMLQQNWSHVTFVLSHLNLQPTDSHGADFTRVRPFYLDSQAAHFRQTLIYSAHVTPELQALFNSTLPLAGRLKVSPIYAGGAITTPLPAPVRQTFTRYDSPSTPASDPDARFAFFTATLVPWIAKTCSSYSAGRGAAGAGAGSGAGAGPGPGILVFIPGYLDFVRVRNYFAADPATEAVRFGQLSEYTSVSEQRRARSHFASGRHQVLLYSGRAHHFHRYRIARAVKRVVWYALPDNERFWAEVNGWAGESVVEGRAEEGEALVKAVFGRWDGLRLERVVGTERVGAMVRGDGGDVFDFL